eukprot:TRINITY_DN94837_c0_g1_i1.p1 TRINITY_DN94837_c0_g1~~TRINITY_DN94837_c0_g1_i1.p1  ORF type:complete len:870 (-),score=176.45 TRINITY_DN94837_c0_g1_i1:41-2650(-)
MQVLEKIRTQFLREEGEWGQAFQQQYKLLSKQELRDFEPRINDAFLALTSEDIDPEDVKGEIEHIFQELRSARCQNQLRSEILPLMKSLPEQYRKPMLAEILELFAELTFTDQQVLENAEEMIYAALEGEQQQQQQQAQEPTEKKKKKKNKEGAPEGGKKEKKKKKGEEAAPQEEPKPPAPEPVKEEEKKKKDKDGKAEGKKEKSKKEKAETTAPAPPKVAVSIPAAPAKTVPSPSVPNDDFEDYEDEPPPQIQLISKPPSKLAAPTSATTESAPVKPISQATEPAPLAPVPTQAQSEPPKEEAKALVTATSLLVEQLRHSQSEATVQLDMRWKALEQQLAELKLREAAVQSQSEVIAEREEALKTREADLQREELEVRQREERCTELLRVAQDRQQESAELEAMRLQLQNLASDLKASIQKAAGVEAELVEKQTQINRLKIRETELLQELHTSNLAQKRAEARVTALAQELTNKAKEWCIVSKDLDESKLCVRELNEQLKECEELRTQVSSLKAQLSGHEELKMMLQSANERIAEFERDLHQREVWSSYADSLRERLHESTTECENLREKLAQVSKTCNGTVEELHTTKLQLSEAVKRVDQLSEYERRALCLQEETNTRRFEVGELMDQIKSRDAQLRAANKKAAALKRQLGERDATISALHTVHQRSIEMWAHAGSEATTRSTGSTRPSSDRRSPTALSASRVEGFPIAPEARWQGMQMTATFLLCEEQLHRLLVELHEGAAAQLLALRRLVGPSPAKLNPEPDFGADSILPVLTQLADRQAEIAGVAKSVEHCVLVLVEILCGPGSAPGGTDGPRAPTPLERGGSHTGAAVHIMRRQLASGTATASPTNGSSLIDGLSTVDITLGL